MDGPKLEWMYKNANDCIDKEEYLLGKPIDKAFEQSQTKFANEIEKDCLPTSIFSNSGSNVQVDVIRKLKEDPLELIRQQEIERRKQLLKNPVKLKKLQNMIKTKENSDSMSNKKSREKKKSTSDSADIDELLTSKYLKIMKKHGIRSLSELSKIKIGKKKEHHRSKRSVDKDSSSSSESDSDEADKKRQKNKFKKRKERRSRSSSSSSDGHKRKHYHSKKEEILDRAKASGKSSKERYIEKSHMERHHKSRPDMLKVSENKKPSRRENSVDKYKSRTEITDSRNKKQKTNCLSDTEKQKRLEEMMQNAKWRDEVRTKNIERYKKEESSEKTEKYSEDFMRNQMVLSMAASNESVESRIKSKINTIQKSKFTMNENFVRR